MAADKQTRAGAKAVGPDDPRDAQSFVSSDHALDDHASNGPVGHLLRRAYHLARENASGLLGDLDLTTRQAAALSELLRRGTLSQADIGLAIDMEPANVHGLIARLKKKALIVAERDPLNTRRKRVHLTKHGGEVARGLAALAETAEGMTLHRLVESEREALIALLRKLLGA